MPSGGDAPLGEQEAGSGPRREVAPGAVSLTPLPAGDTAPGHLR